MILAEDILGGMIMIVVDYTVEGRHLKGVRKQMLTGVQVSMILSRST